VGFEVRNKLLHLWYPDILTISADYSDEYIQDIKNTGRPQEGRKTYVRRTKSLKLDEVEDRITALKWIFGLGKYLASGQARIATLQASRAIAAGQI
jgi:hypothetical protein